MTPLFVGWYLPVSILLLRDPLVRDVLKEMCVRGTIAAAQSVATIVRFGGISLFRLASRKLREMRRTFPFVVEDGEWCVVRRLH